MMINMKIKKVIVIVLEQQKEKIQVYYYNINRQIKKISVERKMMIIKLIIKFLKKKKFLKIRNNQAFCQTFSLNYLFFEFNNYKEIKCLKKLKNSKIIINLNI